MSDSVQNNSSPAPEFDPYYGQEGDDSWLDDAQDKEMSLGEGPDTNFYGDTKSNVSKDDIRKLYQGIDAKNLPNEKELLATLREALKDASSSDQESQDKANTLYNEVSQKLQDAENNTDTTGNENTDGSTSSGDDPSKTDSQEAINSNFDDSVPTEIDKKNKTAKYTKDSEVQLHPNYNNQDIQNYDVSADKVTIEGVDRTDKFTVTYDSSSNKYIVKAQGNDDSKKSITNTFSIDASKQIIFNVPAGNVDFSALSGDQLKKIRVLDDQNKSVIPGWPTLEELNNKLAHTGDSAAETADALSKLDSGMQKGDFSEFSTALGGLSEGRANDVVRKITTALYKAAGSDNDKFSKLLQLIPEDVRQLMYERVSWTPELDSDHGVRSDQEIWNNRLCAQKIAETLPPGTFKELPKGNTTPDEPGYLVRGGEAVMGFIGDLF